MTRLTAIVIVNFASHLLIRDNLGSAVSADDAWRVVVVDNFSSAGEREAIAALCTQRRWELVAATNTGFGSGVNRAVEHAITLGCTSVIVLNPDLQTDSSALSRLADLAATEPMTLHCPTILRKNGSIWFAGGDVLLAQGRTTTAPGASMYSPTAWLSGACLAFSTELFSRAGGMDDSYFMYWEDVDFSWRCRDVGAALRIYSDLTVIHAVGGTQSGAGKSPLYVYYNCRNRLLFAAKRLDRVSRRRWLWATLPYARRVVLRGGRREFLGSAIPLSWAALRGSWSGILWLIGHRTAAQGR